MEFPEVRLSDDERQEALDALDEHVRTGRLDIAEYGERSAQVTAARTRGDLEPLFTDLPTPRPAVLQDETIVSDDGSAGTQRDETSLWHRASSVALPVAVLLAVVLLAFVVRTYVVFLIPIAVAVLGPRIFHGRKR